jgi:hypothetical protein
MKQILASVLLVGATVVAAQAPRAITITGNPACARCRIELLPVAMIGGTSSGDEIGGGPLAFMAMDSHGRIFVSDRAALGAIQIFDTTGRRLGKTGRDGKGPGEFNPYGVGLLVGEGDSVHVFDARNARHSVLAPGGKYVRAYPWIHTPSPPQLMRLNNGLMAVSEIKQVNGHWFGVHIVDSLDRAVRSFAPSTPRWQGANWLQLSNLAQGSAPDRILVQHVWEYLIEEWSTQGKLLSSIRREAPWFVTNEMRDPAAGGTALQLFPPKCFMSAVWRDPSGLLWSVIGLPDRKWEESLEDQVGSHGNTIKVPSDFNRFYDIRIEVIDPASGTLVASQRFDRAYLIPIGDGVLASPTTEGPSGEPAVYIVRPRLVRP